MKIDLIRKFRVRAWSYQNRVGNIWNSTHLGAAQNSELGVRTLGLGFLSLINLANRKLLTGSPVQAVRDFALSHCRAHFTIFLLYETRGQDLFLSRFLLALEFSDLQVLCTQEASVKLIFHG